jgi:AcrR family transcriptional regulator
MGRPRKVSDEDVYGAAMRVMSRVGPSELTLNAIAEEAGVTAGALVQRFGSKHELMVTMAGLLGSGMREFFADLRQKHDSPLEVLRAYAECMAEMAKTPGALLRNFAYLQVDLTDPDLRKQLVAQSRVVHQELETTVTDAIGRGELSRDVDVPALVNNIEAIISGALLTWAFYRKGSAAAWLRQHMDALLAPHVAPKQGQRQQQRQQQLLTRKRPKSTNQSE